MMRRTGPREDREKRQGIVWLAGAGMWIALGAVEVLAPGPAGWVRVTFGCCMGFSALSFIAVYRRDRRRAGNGLSARGRGDDYGSGDEAVHGWRTLAAVSRLMPRSAGRRWLAEAASLLAEIPAARRGEAVRSYLLSAPRLAVMMWAREVLRQPRSNRRRPG